ALLIVVIFAVPIIGESAQKGLYPIHPSYGNIEDIGMVLFTKYLIPFEVAAVMLLVAMIGGIILAGKKMDVSYSEMSEEEIETYEKELAQLSETTKISKDKK
ncbi:MAG: NADH-quinone oxidoreductase subunit J, partial [Campylobacteraceae bacterium]|nr:NADH-quinone oxidoreductase subunit J [Campylobacteraceae bacterium]